ncbi:hypothetical protein SAMN05421770_102482 [Granulicella rosea]|uniref:DUF2971 domain-containing protein n=1 Tax=Granulicella rosea TaxID=474952 RepID=A0A239HP60_9BACT|nr:hypothetical protein [Granulicella rosea]SNS82915.1 hypothetical protein SAMN05421770_102482 [Granulicella rosea]
MSFSMNPLALASSIWDEVVSGVWQREFGSHPTPPELHHYAKLPAVLGIIENQCFWSKSLADQEDSTELSHGIGWMQDELERRLPLGLPFFAKAVLEEIPAFLKSRKSWTFITCFCDEDASDYHWKRFGNFRLTLPFSSSIEYGLQSSAWGSERWYQPVIYDHTEQGRIVSESVDAILRAIQRFTVGDPGGPWIQSMAKECARDAGQLLLVLLAGFKNKIYEAEKEWRLVTTPKFAIASSAPKMSDEGFARAILQNPRRIELKLPSRNDQYGRWMRPGLPFTKVKQYPKVFSSTAHEEIRNLMSKHDFVDVECS